MSIIAQVTLQKLREASALTQGKVAQRVGISRCYYSQLENATRRPSLEVAGSLAEVFRVSVDDIFLATRVTSRNTAI